MKEEDLEELLDVLQGSRAKGRLQELLKEKELAHSGTWEDVRKRIAEANADNSLTDDELVGMIDEIEAYGAKHVFLLRLTPELTKPLKDPAHLATAARHMGIKLGESKFVPKPDEATLVSFSHGQQELLLKWVRQHKWLEFRTEEEEQRGKGKWVVKNYEWMFARAVSVLRIDLASRYVEVRIDSHAHLKYDDEYLRVKKATKPLVDLSKAARVDLVEVIKPLIESEEVRTRRGRLGAADGTTVELSSSEETKGFKDNKFYQGGKEAAGDEMVGKLANVYFLPERSNGKLSREVHVVIDEDNQVVFPSTAVTRDEVEYVLRRIRALEE